MQRNGHPRFFELVEMMADTHARKNADYTGGGDPLANFRSSEEYGVDMIAGTTARLNDKIMRFKTLMRQYNTTGRATPAVTSESLYDTILDAANYFLLLYIMLEERAGECGDVGERYDASERNRIEIAADDEAPHEGVVALVPEYPTILTESSEGEASMWRRVKDVAQQIKAVQHEALFEPPTTEELERLTPAQAQGILAGWRWRMDGDAGEPRLFDSGSGSR